MALNTEEGEKEFLKKKMLLVLISLLSILSLQLNADIVLSAMSEYIT